MGKTRKTGEPQDAGEAQATGAAHDAGEAQARSVAQDSVAQDSGAQGSLAMPLGARIHRLQRIVADLEREDIELEDAMRLFEEGVSHLRAAETLVAQTELRIERLLEDSDGVRLDTVAPEG
jgi:exodeoxyribonuclease VII small subunit